MPPYRSGPELLREAPAPEDGLVLEMVRQFADPYAFVRELVQNAIDAGATHILVSASRDDDGVVRTTVDDDGSGMARTTVEGPLLTLFQSSKEDAPDKIGKYGVGFMSVFATRPARIELRTRTVNEAWLVTLAGDHSYELAQDDARSEGAGGTGTSVTLVHGMDPDTFDVHAKATRTALARWCRHAHVPITFDGEVVNRPFEVDGLVTVSAAEDGVRWVVGVGGGAGPSSVGFYNRGLTLFESREAEEGLQGIHVKIDAPRLAHTLSRDSVRRDAELRRVLRRAVDLVRGPLLEALLSRIAVLANQVDAGADADLVAQLSSLLSALSAPAFAARMTHVRASVAVPLLEPLRDGRRVATVRELASAKRDAVAAASSRSPLTRALAARGVLVLPGAPLLAELASLLGGLAFAPAVSSWVLASTAGLAPHPQDAALLAEVARVLSATGRSVARVRLATFEGTHAERRHMVASATEAPREANDAAVVLHVRDVLAEPRWSPTSVLLLHVEDAVVRLARRKAKTDPALAGQLLVRALLLAGGALAKDDVDRLLTAAAEPRHG